MGQRLCLPERLDSSAAGPLCEMLLDAQGHDLALDASRVTVLGGLCAELLIAAAQLWARAGHGFSIETPSTSFAENLERLGTTPEALTGGSPA